MQSIVVMLLALLAFLLTLMMLMQGLSRKVDLFSVRNLYLFSFLVYQIISPAYVLYADYYPMFKINTPEHDAQTFLVYCYAYVFILLLSYHRVKISSWFASKLSGPPRTIDDSFFLGLAVMLVFIAVPLRFLGPSVPLLSKASVQISIAMAAVASAIAGWVWGGRRFNPMVIAMMVFIVGSSLGIGMYGAFGRRPLLSILLGMAWGFYHRRARDIKPIRLILGLLPIVLFVALAVSAFTAIRNNRDTAQSQVTDTVSQMSQANVGSGAQNIITGQTCGAASFWCIENYPTPIEPRYLYSMKVLVCWYIPSIYWEDKPVPLGNHIAKLARIPRVNQDKLTLPPGVIGYAAAEGGWIAIIVYALFYGQFLRFFDELVRLNPKNAFILLPVGCATGQVLGLARGCIAIFANLMIMGFIATYVFLFVANKFFGRDSQPNYWYPWPQPR